MKLLVILSICFVVTLSDVSSTKYLDAFITEQWNDTNEVQTSISVDRRLKKPWVKNKWPHETSKVYKESHKVASTFKNIAIEDDNSKLRRYYLECINDTSVSHDRIVKFKAGSWFEHPSVLDWALCMLVKVDLMTPQGVFRYDTAMSKIRHGDVDKVDKILNRCLTSKPLSPQKKAWKYLKCIKKQDKKNRFPSLSIFYSL